MASPSDYLPLDSDAPSVFYDVYQDNFVIVAFMALMIYDHVTTMDREVERIWTLNWRLPKFLFITNRYIVPPLLIIVAISYLLFPLSIPNLYSCTFVMRLKQVLYICSLVTAQSVLVIRLCAIYDHSKIFARALVAFLAAEICAVISLTVVLLRQEIVGNWYYGLPGCSAQEAVYSYVIWIPFVITDGTLLLLMLYKIIYFRGRMSPIVTLLARDSILYFLLIFGGLAMALVPGVIASPFDLTLPSQVIACLGVSHMMMNMRGLVFDNPNHTTRLRTLVFGAGSTTKSTQDDIELTRV